ncbi:MAG: nitroreductase family protein [Alphaproteobacteria bacterium]|nr:nitroreductase family protein [Alphaproteobacteria bacterium]
MLHCIEQDSLERRRSVYGLGSSVSVSEACFLDTISSCLKHCPTAFNVQSARLAVLFDKEHHRFWDLVWQNMSKLLTGTQIASSKARLDGFKRAYATILFFEDTKALADLKKRFPLYKKNMSVWMQQGNGMLQYMIWQTLAENEIGASLQHYNELVEADIHQVFNIPKHWKLVAQMPCGSIEKEPAPKTFLPIEDRLLVLK